MYFYAYIGVVGRTGAGKTTLFSAILRLTELESGQILIDDIDVSKVELKNLRSNIAGMFFTFTLKIMFFLESYNLEFFFHFTLQSYRKIQYYLK